MSEERFCPHCQKKLRSDNTRGMCSKCQQRGRTLNGVYGLEPSRPAQPKAEIADIDTAAVMAKFRAVTKALNLDEEAILAEAAQGWMDGLSDILNGKAED